MLTGKIRLLAKTLAASTKYNRYLSTGSPQYLIAAERLAHKVGELDNGKHCPLLFIGKPNLEREWASGKGGEFFLGWLMRRGYKPGTFRQTA